MDIKGFNFEKRIADIITPTIPSLPSHLSARTLRTDGKQIVTRRHFLKSFAIGGAAVGLWPRLLIAQPASGNDRPQEFQWRVPMVHFETIRDELSFEGEVVQEKDPKGLLLIQTH